MREVCKDCWNELCKLNNELVEDKIKIGKCVDNVSVMETVKEIKEENAEVEETVDEIEEIKHEKNGGKK